MDGPHTRQHGTPGGNRRGGRSGTAKMEYRRVQSVTTDDHGNGSGNGNADEPKPAFRSSLLQSIKKADDDASKSKKEETTDDRRGRSGGSQDTQQQQAKRGGSGRGASPKRGGGGGGGRGNGAGERRSRSPRKVQSSGGRGSGGVGPAADDSSGRQVTMTTSGVSARGTRSERAGSIESNVSTASSTSRWVRKSSDNEPPAKPFVSSLLRSASSQNARNAGDSRAGSNGGRGSYNRSASRESSSSFRRSEGGESYRRVEMSRDRRLSSDRSTFTPQLTAARLARGRTDSMESDASERSVQSVQSVHSVQSVRSVRSTASSRYDSKPRPASDRYNSRRSIDDGRREDRGSFSSRYKDDRPPPPPTRRFERSTSDHSVTSSHNPSNPSSPAVPLRGSTLASSSLRSHDVRKTPSPITATKPLVKSAQDVRFAGGDSAGSATGFKSSLRASTEREAGALPFKSSLASSVDAKPFTSSLAASAKAPPAFKSSLSVSAKESPPFKSSLGSSLNGDNQSKEEGVVDEQERKRLAAERLKARMEARNAERGASSSLLAGKTSLRSSLAASARDDIPNGSARPESRTSNILSRVGDRAPPAEQSDKEARAREHFAKIQREEEKREQARRVENPVVSSLRQSLASRREIAPKQVVNKVVYTLLELRNLKPTTPVKPPSDLRDMTLAEVIEIRPPGRPLGNAGGSSSRHVESSSRRGGSKRGGLARGASGSGQSSRGGAKSFKNDKQRPASGRGRGGPPPPPLYDGPIEPLQVSENRWVPKKADLSVLEATLSHVKSVLNKLTREKFAKLTEELCKTDINSMELLRSIITVIMDKAIQEPSFADVYSDLCKQFHVRTSTKVWKFLRAVESTTKPGVFMWTAINPADSAGFVGPLSSETECIEAAATSEPTETIDQDISKAKLFATSKELVAVIEVAKNQFYYRNKSLEALSEDEPLLGEYESAAAAVEAAAKQTSFKRLLVTRCQFEFERFNKSQAADNENPDLDARQKELNAMRAKRLMLGNIRFIGELFKADLLNQSVVQACLFHLLGLELVKAGSDDQLAGQDVRLPDEEDVEALCKLLATVGKKYDQPKTQMIMRIVILRLVQLSEDKQLPSRARFLLKDVLEMRDHVWEPRRKEMQQKTLEEVRREAQKLQSQGKNAQHDDLKSRRLKSQVSSAQLAKESSNLLVRKDTLSDIKATSPRNGEAQEASNGKTDDAVDYSDPAKVKTRIKSIIQEYGSIHDIEEAATCVRELPVQVLPDFAEYIVNRALEGKEQERQDVVDLLVKLYERRAIDATSIQLALINVIEFLEDIKIDIPLVHQYSAHLLGRLIAAGCFGLSWMVSKALHGLLDCGLASLVFAEVLPVIEADSDERTVIRMVADEEITPGSVLPPSKRRNEAAIAAYIEEHDLGVYFGAEREHEDEGDDEEEELDPEVEGKLKSTLVEYLSVKDLDEVVLCVTELVGTSTSPAFMWRHFVHVGVMFSLDNKQATRLEVAALLTRLVTERSDNVSVEDLEWAFESALLDYEDFRVDVPQLAHNYAELWVALFEKPECLTLAWLHDAVMHLLGSDGSDGATEILSALLTRFESVFGREKLTQWWQQQPKPSQDDAKNWLVAFSSSGEGTVTVHERLKDWEPIVGVL